MSDAWQSSKLQEFEQVLAGSSTALLRVAAKPARRRSSVARRPVLVVNVGPGVHRFVAVPSPPDGRGILRAAYSVPVQLIQPETGFSLELDDGRCIALPAPTPGAARVSSGAPADDLSEPPPDGAEPAAPDAGERRADPIDQLAELSAALAQAESVNEQAEATLAELQTWQGELERRLAATTTELAAVKAARLQDERQLDRLRGELGEAEAKFVLARAELQTLRAGLERAHAANESDQLELIRLSAEADARLQAEQELTRAAERRSER